MITPTTNISTNSVFTPFDTEKSDSKTLSELEATIVTAFEDFLKTLQSNTPAKFSYDLPSSQKSYIAIELTIKNKEKLEAENADVVPIDGSPRATTDALSQDTLHKINYTAFFLNTLNIAIGSANNTFEINEKNTNEYEAYINEFNLSKTLFLLDDKLIGFYQLTDIVDPENLVSQELQNKLNSKAKELQNKINSVFPRNIEFNNWIRELVIETDNWIRSLPLIDTDIELETSAIGLTSAGPDASTLDSPLKKTDFPGTRVTKAHPAAKTPHKVHPQTEQLESSDIAV